MARARGRGSAPIDLTTHQARAYSSRKRIEGEAVTVSLGIFDCQRVVEPLDLYSATRRSDERGGACRSTGAEAGSGGALADICEGEDAPSTSSGQAPATALRPGCQRYLWFGFSSGLGASAGLAVSAGLAAFAGLGLGAGLSLSAAFCAHFASTLRKG